MLTIHEEQGFIPTRRTISIKDDSGKVQWQRVCNITQLEATLEQAAKELTKRQAHN